MRSIKGVWRISFLVLAIVLCMQAVGAECKELKPISVELESCNAIYSSKDNVCLVPTFKLSNPNDQLILATIDYSLRFGGQILGSAQMPTIYLPSGGAMDQRDAIVLVYKSWFARLYFEGKSPGEAMKILLPLWKGLDGKEPAKVPEGMWSKIVATTSKIEADGSITLADEDGTERIFFFKTSVKGSKQLN